MVVAWTGVVSGAGVRAGVVAYLTGVAAGAGVVVAEEQLATVGMVAQVEDGDSCLYFSFLRPLFQPLPPSHISPLWPGGSPKPLP